MDINENGEYYLLYVQWFGLPDEREITLSPLKILYKYIPDIVSISLQNISEQRPAVVATKNRGLPL